MKNSTKLIVRETNSGHPIIPKIDQHNPGFSLVVVDSTSSESLQTSWGELHAITSAHYSNIANENEKKLIEVIRNFVRKFNFQELNESLKNEDINWDEFEKELEEHEDKYTVNLHKLKDDIEFAQILNLVNKIGLDLRDFSTSEISEMFSVIEKDLINFSNSNKTIL